MRYVLTPVPFFRVINAAALGSWASFQDLIKLTGPRARTVLRPSADLLTQPLGLGFRAGCG